MLDELGVFGAVSWQRFLLFILQYKGNLQGAILLTARHERHYDHAIPWPRTSLAGLGRASAWTNHMRQAYKNSTDKTDEIWRNWNSQTERERQTDRLWNENEKQSDGDQLE